MTAAGCAKARVSMAAAKARKDIAVTAWADATARAKWMAEAKAVTWVVKWAATANNLPTKTNPGLTAAGLVSAAFF